MINEVTGKAKEIVDIEKVQIIFLDLMINLKNRIYYK
jgi:hypothetical protein